MPTPLSTYRLQLGPGFGFDQAAAIADYLAELGVTHLYAAPSLQAAPGSTHGYDVADPTRVSLDLGGEEAHRRLCDALGRARLGHVLDIVPNHTWVGGPGNRWWWDVLARGPASEFADYFDIDWEEASGPSPRRVLLPVLGEELEEALQAGHIRLAAVAPGELPGDLRLVIRYWDHVFPVGPGTLATAGVDKAGEGCEDTAARISADRHALEALMARQHYRLAHWRVASTEVNYRRFFHITQLAGMRAEDPKVFAHTHRLVLSWLREGRIDGLRIDHVDGLRDPAAYLARLREAAGPDAWIVVEKILEPDEELRPSWPIAGTTGYEFGTRAGGVLVDPAGDEPLTRFYVDLTGTAAPWAEVVYDSKLLVLAGILAAEVERLVELFMGVCAARGRSEPRAWLRDTIREAVAAFPVYRSYVRAGAGEIDEEDRRVINEAISRAIERRRHLVELLEVLRGVLLLEERSALGNDLVMRFQQLTGPAMAKGLEDTAEYRYLRLSALNEVGGDPGRFGVAVEDFHKANARLQERWPHAMLTTSTHDTKRGEDVRARLLMLSEIPQQWEQAVRRWMALLEPLREGDRPSRNSEYLLYQTMFGGWPMPLERLCAYMEKAIREEQRQTSWIDPDPEYEAAVQRFVEGAVAHEAFQADLREFAEPLREPGFLNALSQALLKLASPGVPDVYQGCELWDGSLVDPDNRRPVNFEKRRALLAELRGGMGPEAIMARLGDGLPKLWLTQQALRLRRERPDAFRGGYEPLSAEGERAEHVVSFLRGGEVLAVAPRLVIGLGGAFANWAWGDTRLRLPDGRWRNVLSGDETHGGELGLADLLRRFPAGLFVRL